MDIIFEVSIETILNIFFICLKNKNNKVFSNMAHEIKNDIENSYYVLLNDYQKDFLNINFLKSAKSHRLIYDNKYKAFIKDMKLNNNSFLIISIVTMDNINTYLLFNDKYVTLNFKQFLFETKNNKINTNLFKYNKYVNIPIETKTNNMIYHRNNKSFRHRNKDKQIKLRNKLNKRYEYLNNNERLFLNKKDRKQPKFYNNSDMSFLERLEYKEQLLDDLKKEYSFIIEDIRDLKEEIGQVNLELDLYNFISYESYLEACDIEIKELESELRRKEQLEVELDNDIYNIEYDIKEMYSILNKDIKENIFYSNINY